MSKLLDEKKVLSKLGIQDFGYLTKDKVITMASMLSKMDPEVAKKAIEQFPNFANAAKELVDDFKEFLDKGLIANKESVQIYYDSCNAMIAVLQKQLENENLSFEERKYIIEKMVEISDKIGAKDSENKKFIAVMSAIGAAAVVVVTGALLTALGGNVGNEKNDDDGLSQL